MNVWCGVCVCGVCVGVCGGGGVCVLAVSQCASFLFMPVVFPCFYFYVMGYVVQWTNSA